MPKRKQSQNVNENDSDSDVSIVDVDFDFCDFKPEIDYLATKRLLQQLLHTDATLFDLGSIADLILSQDDVGSTVKTDGVDSDPLAFLAVLSLDSHPALQTLKDYLLSKVTANPAFQKTLKDNLSTIGLIIGERVYNMPPQVMPPLYKILHEEIGWAIEENKPYRFSHYLILSRIYKTPPGEEEEEQASPTSKRRKTTNASSKISGPAVRTFHPEDECIQKVALHSLDYDYSHQEPRTKGDIGSSAAGVDVGGRVMLIPADKLERLAQDMATMFPPPS